MCALMADEPKFKTKSVVSKPAQKYGRNLWIALGVVLALGALGAAGWAGQWHQNRRAQTNAYEAAQRNIEHAKTLEDPQRSIKVWRTAINSLKKVEPGHPKYNSAQEDISAYSETFENIQKEANALEAIEEVEARAAVEGRVAAYNAFLKAFDPDGLAVSSIALDPNIENQIVVTVGTGWGIASKTNRLDLADSLWKAWGRACECFVPRIKFKSQAGRDLGGTGMWGTAIELKD